MGIVSKDGRDAWSLDLGASDIHLILSESELEASDILNAVLTENVLTLEMLGPHAPLPRELVESAKAIIIEVQPDSETSMRRIQDARRISPNLAIFAAVRDISVRTVRALIRGGVNDVIALPLQAEELAQIIADFRQSLATAKSGSRRAGQLISVIKSVGGVGASTIATQLASLQARQGQADICLFDLDLQFGNAGIYLGVGSPLNLADLLSAGSRVDGDLLRTVTVKTPSGLHVVTAPEDIMPMEAVNADQIYRVIELAHHEFDAVYLDLPGNWTNWSLSLAARSQTILLVIEMTIASLRQARRQIALLRSQDIDLSRLHVVVNRIDKGLFRSISFKDAEQAIDHPIAFSIANDFPLVSSALDQGMLIEELKPRSRICSDLKAILPVCVPVDARPQA